MLQKKTLGAGLAALVLVSSVVLGGVAYARSALGPGVGSERLLKRAAVVLDLSDSQTTQIRAIVQKNMETARPLLMQAHQAHNAFRDAIESGKTDKATLQPLADRMGQTVAQLAMVKAQALGEIYPILTPEQRDKAKKLHDVFRDSVQQRFLQ